MSKLNFNGRAGQGNFLTLPSVCSSSTTSHLEVESYEGEISRTETHTPVGVEGCGKVPFEPTVEVTPETAASDQPDGATTVVKAKQNVGADEINTADIQDAHVTLPEGMTLNPPAANGLGVCTAAQIAIGTTRPEHLSGIFQDRNGHDRNRPAAGLAHGRRVPGRSSGRADHEASVHDLPGR